LTIKVVGQRYLKEHIYSTCKQY